MKRKCVVPGSGTPLEGGAVKQSCGAPMNNEAAKQKKIVPASPDQERQAE